MNSRATLVFLLIAALPALACAGGETQEEAQGEMQEQGTEAASEPAMSTGTATVQLASLNNSMISGTAMIEHSADSLHVTLQLTGLEAGQSYPAHVHRGSCQEQGPVAAPLGSIRAAEGGSGSVRVALDMGQFRDQHAGHEMQEGGATGYYVQVHSPDGAPAACGDVMVEMSHEQM